jgi:hypothetical protein
VMRLQKHSDESSSTSKLMWSWGDIFHSSICTWLDQERSPTTDQVDSQYPETIPFISFQNSPHGSFGIHSRSTSH